MVLPKQFLWSAFQTKETDAFLILSLSYAELLFL